MPRVAEDLTDRMFGTREVIRRAPDKDYGEGKAKVIYWETRCTECGALAEVQGGSLKTGSGCGTCYRLAHQDKGVSALPKPQRVRKHSPKRSAAAVAVAVKPFVAAPKKRSPKNKVDMVRQAPPLNARTVGEYLASCDAESPVLISLVSEEGLATKPIKGVTFTGGVVILHAEMPEALTGWPQ